MGSDLCWIEVPREIVGARAAMARGAGADEVWKQEDEGLGR